MPDDRRRLVDRVLKLYALAAGTSFAAEADTARAKAEALIAKHNIELPSTKDRTAFAWVAYRPHFKGAQWELILADAVAKFCGCELFLNKEGFEACDPNVAMDEGWQVARPEVREYVDTIDQHVASVGYGVTGRFHHPFISACRWVRDHGIGGLSDWRP